jgi:signal transduction histidine kinase
LRQRLLLGLLAFTVAVLVGLEVPLGTTFRSRERQTLVASLQRDATALSALALDSMENHDLAGLRPVASRFAHQAGAAVTVFDTSGRVVLAEGPTPSRALRSRLSGQIADALRGATPSGIVRIPGPDLLYVATPIGAARSFQGVIVIAATTAKLEDRVRRNWLELGGVGLAVLAAGALLGLVLTRSLTRPLGRLEEAVARLAAGDLGARASVGKGPAELVELGRRFDAMAQRLEELLASQRAFVADASHQLRSPLTALRLRLESVEATLEPGQRPDLEAAVAEVYRLSRLVDGLLALARVEGARPQRAPVDVLAVARDRCEAWGPLAEERGVEIVAPMEGEAVASIVPGFLEQVIDNLLANAIEASPAGTTVQLSVVVRPPEVELHVVDEGPGMNPAERTRAFDRFWRREGAGRDSGSGLGLAIVHQLVRSSGGSVELRDGPAGGLDAVVRLERATRAIGSREERVGSHS